MSKESSAGYDCPGCGLRITFTEQHWPVCPGNPNNLTGTARTHMEARFTKAELASIATHGAMKDHPVQKRRRSNPKAKK